VVGQLVVVLSLPLIARLFGPEAIGVQSSIQSVATILAALAGLRFEQLIPSVRSHVTSIRLALASVALPVLLTALLVPTLVLSAANSWEFGYALVASGAYVVVLHLSVVARVLALRAGRTRALALTSVVQGGGRSILPVVLGTLASTWSSLAVGDLLGRVLGIRSLVTIPLFRLARVVSRNAWTSLARALRDRSGFAVVASISALINAAAIHAVIPSITALYGADAGGTFAIAMKTILLPTVIIGVATGDIMQRSLGRMPRAEHLGYLLRQTALLAIVAGFGIAIAVAKSDAIAQIAFGSRYPGAGNYLAVLSIWGGAAFIGSPLSRYFFVVERVGLKLTYDVVALCAQIVAIVVVFRLGGSGVQAATAVAVAAVFAYAILVGVVLALAGRLARPSADSSRLE
jgi:O-antigen/teichoic acid export membrane protein